MTTRKELYLSSISRLFTSNKDTPPRQSQATKLYFLDAFDSRYGRYAAPTLLFSRVYMDGKYFGFAAESSLEKFFCREWHESFRNSMARWSCFQVYCCQWAQSTRPRNTSTILHILAVFPHTSAPQPTNMGWRSMSRSSCSPKSATFKKSLPPAPYSFLYPQQHPPQCNKCGLHSLLTTRGHVFYQSTSITAAHPLTGSNPSIRHSFSV